MFDPTKDEFDLRKLEEQVITAFKNHCATLATKDPGALLGVKEEREIEVKRERMPDGKRVLALRCEIDAFAATKNAGLDLVAERLGRRETAFRMLNYFVERGKTFPELTNINFDDLSDEAAFNAVWLAAYDAIVYDYANGREVWEDMRKNATAPFSTRYFVWTKVVLDPQKPKEQQLRFDAAYTVDSPFLTESENAGGALLSFGQWFKGSAENPKK